MHTLISTIFRNNRGPRDMEVIPSDESKVIIVSIRQDLQAVRSESTDLKK